MTEQFAEAQFEKLLVDLGIEYQRVPVASKPTPDFEFTTCGRTIVVEVKQIEMNAEDRRVLADLRAKKTASYWIANRVRGKLKDISRQLRPSATTGNPTIVVLYNNVPLYDHTCADDILDAMFGEKTYTLSWPFDRTAEPAITRVHAGGSRAVTFSDNTSLSAVAVLTRAGDPARLCVYHNPFARVELPTEVPCRLAARQFRVRLEPDTELPRWEEIAG